MAQTKLFLKPHNYQFDDLLQKLANGKKVFDFHKIEELFNEFNIFVIFSERGNLGKTTNLKIKALDDFLTYNKTSLFMRNQETEIENEKNIFLSNSTIQADNRFADVKIEKDRAKYKGEEFLFFNSISSASKLKGSRPDIKNIVYDEINEGLRFIKGSLNEKISSIQASTYNIVKNYQQKSEDRFWLLGNYKSINHPYILKLGVRNINEPINLYYQKTTFKDGTAKFYPLFVLILSTFDENDEEKYIKENLQYDWRLRADLQTNQIEHTYFNKSLINESLNVCIVDKPKTFYFGIITENEFIKIEKIHNYNHYYVSLIDKKEWEKWLKQSNNLYCFNKKLISENIQFSKLLQKKLIDLVYDNSIFYKSVASRVSFLNSLLV